MNRTFHGLTTLITELMVQTLIYGDVVLTIKRSENYDAYLLSREDVRKLEDAQKRELQTRNYHPGGNVGAALDAIDERAQHFKMGVQLSNEDYEGFRLMVKLAHSELAEARKTIENMKGINVAMMKRDVNDLAEHFCDLNDIDQAAFFRRCGQLMQKWPECGAMMQMNRVGELLKDDLNARLMIEAIDDGFTWTKELLEDGRREPNHTNQWPTDHLVDHHLKEHARLEQAGREEPIPVTAENTLVSEGSNRKKVYLPALISKEILEASKSKEDSFVNLFDNIPKTNDFMGDAYKYTGPMQLGPMARTPMEKMETVMDLMRENLISGEEAKDMLGWLNAPTPKGEKQAPPPRSLLTAAARESAKALVAKAQKPSANFIIKNINPTPVACGSNGNGGGSKKCDCGGAKAKTTHSDWCSTRC